MRNNTETINECGILKRLIINTYTHNKYRYLRPHEKNIIIIITAIKKYLWSFLIGNVCYEKKLSTNKKDTMCK